MTADDRASATPQPRTDAPSDVDPAWTLEEASAYFAEGGLPLEEERLKLIIRALRWKPAGERRVPGTTGRGKPVYPVADLMRLHSAVAPWVAVQGPMGGRDPDPAAGSDPYYGKLDADQGRHPPGMKG